MGKYEAAQGFRDLCAEIKKKAECSRFRLELFGSLYQEQEDNYKTSPK